MSRTKKHSANFESSKALANNLGFKPACFRCRSWCFEWEEKRKVIWLICANCKVEYQIITPIPTNYSATQSVSIDVASLKALERNLEVTPHCFRCDRMYFDWKEKETLVWLRCVECGLTCNVKIPFPRHSRPPPPEDKWRY